ncbi:MAG: hypothetical protein QW689_05495 [Nitrososphaerota archaeon]
MSGGGRGLPVPKRWGQKDPDWLSFLNYYREHVKEAIRISKAIAEETDSALFHTILSNTLSHIAYLWSEWVFMTSEQKLPYVTDPEYKAKLEKQIEEARKVAEQIGKVNVK